ncbi:hypothetical protein [uncultured Clostridium sp.]|nr:hypothetical protein [uncultured Clostridium sp.]
MTKVNISFKDTPEDKELLEYLKKKSKIIGQSSYIKQLLYEQLLKENESK